MHIARRAQCTLLIEAWKESKCCNLIKSMIQARMMDGRWLNPFTFKMKPTTHPYNYLLEETFSALFVNILTKCCINYIKNSLWSCSTNSALSLKFMNENAHSLHLTTSRRVLCECWTFARINKIETANSKSKWMEFSQIFYSIDLSATNQTTSYFCWMFLFSKNCFEQ